MGVPLGLERRRHLEHLGDLGAGEALVEHPQRLVVQVEVHVALHGQELDGALAAPGGPVVRREHHVELVAEQVDGLGQVVGPGMRVAHHARRGS